MTRLLRSLARLVAVGASLLEEERREAGVHDDPIADEMLAALVELSAALVELADELA